MPTTYPYGTKGAPTVGNNLGGLPRRIEPVTTAAVTPEYQDFAVVIVGLSPFVHVYKRVGDTLVSVDSATHGISLSANPSGNPVFSKSGKYLAIPRNFSGNGFSIWKCVAGKFTFLTHLSVDPQSAVFGNFSPDDRFFAGGYSGGTKVWSINSSTDTFTETPALSSGLPSGTNSPCFSSDGTYLATSGLNNYGISFYKWDGTKYNYLTKVLNGYETRHPSFTSDDLYVLYLGGSSTQMGAVKRTGDSFAGTWSINGYPVGGGTDRYQLNIRNNYMLLWDFANSTGTYGCPAARYAFNGEAATGIPMTNILTTYNDAWNSCPNLDGTYFFSTGYYDGALRLTKKTGTALIVNVTTTGELTGGSSSGSTMATRCTAATIRIN